MGTLVANALGGFLIGLVLAWTAATPDIPPAVRLFIVTGFLGGLTTFSTFSAEAFTFIEAGRFLQARVPYRHPCDVFIDGYVARLAVDEGAFNINRRKNATLSQHTSSL